MRLALLVPAYNADPWSAGALARLREVVDELRRTRGVETWLVVVDDGSTRPGTQVQAHEAALRAPSWGLLCARHCVNRGQGAALQTALDLARKRADADVFVTFDADGQHQPEDLPALLRGLEGGANIVFGNRFAEADPRGIPLARKWLLRAAGRFDRAVSGVRVTDAHNGLRAFDRRAAAVIQLRQDRMAHATEFKQLVARHRLAYAEVPVRITYSEETLAMGQGNLNALNIVRELARGWLVQ